MSLTRNAEATASRTADSRWLELLARAGFIGYGIVHLLFAWLGAADRLRQRPARRATRPARCGRSGRPAARQVPADRDRGRPDRHGDLAGAGGGRRAPRRAGQGSDLRAGRLGRPGHRLPLAWPGPRSRSSQDASSNSADQQEAISASKLMASTGGRWLVGLAGLVLAARRHRHGDLRLKKKFEQHLKTGEMSPKTRTLDPPSGHGRLRRQGCRVFAIAGLLVVVAAVKYDPEKARGLDAALRTLRDQPYGAVPAGADGARHRRVRRLLLLPVPVPQGLSLVDSGNAGHHWAFAR